MSIVKDGICFIFENVLLSGALITCVLSCGGGSSVVPVKFLHRGSVGQGVRHSVRIGVGGWSGLVSFVSANFNIALHY